MITRRELLKGLTGSMAYTMLPGCISEQAGYTSPNVLFILVDDMGWAELGCYGHPLHETPNIDSLANRGVRFTSGYAASPLCSPTRASILAGKYPSRLGITNWIPGEDFHDTPLLCEPTNQFLPLGETTFAEAFSDGGYQTAHVGKWHLGRKNYYPEHQGFDVNIAGNHWGHPRKGYFSPYHLENLEDGKKGEYLTDRLTSEAIEVLEGFSSIEKPWLMNLSYYTVHAPFHAKREKVQKYRKKARAANMKINARYAAMIESLDENIGRIMSWLDTKGLIDNTIIVFTSDNGGSRRATTNKPLRGAKGELYEGGIRVPWIITWPGVTEPGTVCDTPVLSTDFYPTLLELTSQRLRPAQHRDGISLVPLLNKEPSHDRGYMIWHYPHYLHRKMASPASAIRKGDLKFIYYYENGRQELYNLATDLGETTNLVDQLPSEASAMKRALESHLQAHGANIPQPNPARRT